MFRKHENRAPNQLFLETKLGIVTRQGDWFHTTSQHIKEYVPGLLKERSLDELVEAAQTWVLSANGIGLLLMMILLLTPLNPWISAGIVIVFHWAWYHSKSVLINLPMTGILKVINSDAFMFVTALIVLSLLGMRGEYLALSLGISFFFLLKLNFLKKLWDTLERKRENDSLSLNDRVLKMVIIQYALHEDVPPSEVKTMEERFKELAFKRKKKD